MKTYLQGLSLTTIVFRLHFTSGVPTSVKLIDVMRADPRNRFIIKGDGNALRAKINSGGQAGRISFSNMMLAQQHDEGEYPPPAEGTEYQHCYSQLNMSKVAASRGSVNGFNAAGSSSTSERNSGPQLHPEDAELSQSFSRLGMPDALSPTFKANHGRSASHIGPTSPNPNNSTISRSQSMTVQGNNDVQQRIRQVHQLQVQQFHQRQSLTLPPHSPSHLSPNAAAFRGQMMRNSIVEQDSMIPSQRSPSGVGMGWNIAGTMSLDRDRDGEERINYLNPTTSNFQIHRSNTAVDYNDYESSCYNNSYSLPLSPYNNFDPVQTSHSPQRQDSNVVGAGRGLRPLGHNTLSPKLMLSVADLSGQGNHRFSKFDHGDDSGLDHSQGRDTDVDVSNISPSVSSVHSQMERDRDRSLVPSLQQSGYDSCSTRSEGDFDGEVGDQDHNRFSNFSPQSSRTNYEKSSRSSTHSTYPSTHPQSSSAFSVNHSNSGSLFSGGYAGLDTEHSPHGLAGLDQTRSMLLEPRSPGLMVPATNPRSFQSELSDPEHHLVEEEINSQLSIPLDKWMIKAWLPIVFSGFDYDVIDSFVARLRDDGGFVTVQDLLDAVARDELTRETLAVIAGFKVGHCNRLDKALGAYNGKCIPK